MSPIVTPKCEQVQKMGKVLKNGLKGACDGPRRTLRARGRRGDFVNFFLRAPLLFGGTGGGVGPFAPLDAQLFALALADDVGL